MSAAASNTFPDNYVETMSSHLPTSERLFPPPTSERLFPPPTSERLFPPPTSETKYRETVVLWIIEEETIPTHDESSLIYDNIKTTVINEGFIGGVSFMGYIYNPPKNMSQEYYEHFKRTCKIPDVMPGCEGVEGTRFNMMLIHIICLSFRKCGTNFLVLSSNKDFGKKTKFPRVCEAMAKRGIRVAVSQPDTIKNLRFC